MDVPPSRYKVVEQGRRLVVIDTWNSDRPVTRQAPQSEAPARPTTPQEARAALRPTPRARSGNSSGVPDTLVTTQAWFDAKGPREVTLDAGAQGILLIAAIFFAVIAIIVILSWGWPVLAIIAFFLAQKPVRAGLRNAVTLWLDMQQRG